MIFFSFTSPIFIFVYCLIIFLIIGLIAALIIFREYKNIDNIMNANIEDLAETEDIGEITAKSIYESLHQEQTIDLLNKLKLAGVNMSKIEEDGLDNRFDGKTFVLTGSLENFSRAEATDIIEKFGGKTSSTITKKTDYVLAGEEAGSKLSKAQSLGIAIITEKEFEEMIK